MRLHLHVSPVVGLFSSASQEAKSGETLADIIKEISVFVVVVVVFVIPSLQADL